MVLLEMYKDNELNILLCWLYSQSTLGRCSRGYNLQPEHSLKDFKGPFTLVAYAAEKSISSNLLQCSGPSFFHSLLCAV